MDLDFNTPKLYASSLYGKIFYSLNNGQNWTEQTTPINDPINSISFLNDNKGIAICSGKVLYTNNGGFVNISEINDLASLINIFPNPTVDILNIQNNSTQSLQFTLYNSLRAKFVDLILTNRTSIIDLSTYSNGIYFYKMTFDNNIVKNGKIIKQ